MSPGEAASYLKTAPENIAKKLLIKRKRKQRESRLALALLFSVLFLFYTDFTIACIPILPCGSNMFFVRAAKAERQSAYGSMKKEK